MTTKKFLAGGFLVAIFLAGFVSYYASSHPDGLEKVAESIGFLETAKDPVNKESVLADYGVRGISDARVSVGLAGIIGVIVTALISYGFFLFLLKRKKK